jgi:hypothetical protein
MDTHAETLEKLMGAYEQALAIISANQDMLHLLMDAHPEAGGPYEEAKEAARAITVDSHLALSRIRQAMPAEMREKINAAA